jgi:hypothetical protein
MFVYAQILPTTTIGVVELFVPNARKYCELESCIFVSVENEIQ